MLFDDHISDDKAKADYHAIREKMATLLHDANRIVMDAFDVLKRMKDRTGNDTHAAAILLARHVIEMADGVGVLVAKGCAEATKPLLRSLLEAAMGMLYILEADSDRRNIAYQVAHAHKQIKLYLKYDPDTPQGRTFAAEMAGDILWQAIKPSLDFPKLAQNLEAMLARPEFAPVEAEWQAMKKPTPRKGTHPASGTTPTRPKDDPHWYALFGGPTKVRELAKRLDMRGEYEYLYRMWSDTIHAGGVMTQVKPVMVGGTKQQVILPVRNPEHLQTCVTVAIALLLKVGNALVAKYAPDEIGGFAAKYVHGIQQRFMSLTNSGPVIAVPW